MANQNQGRQAGDPCAYCGQPLTSGKFGAWCKPCNDAYKARQGQSKTYTAPRQNYQPTQPATKTNNDDIRANVALKMTSEIIASGKAELKDWKKLADTFYYYKPSFATPPVSLAMDIVPTRPYEQGEQEEPIPDFPF